MKPIKLLTLFMAFAFAWGSVSADDEKKPTRAEEKLAKITEKYEATGETKRCIPLRMLRESTVIDDQTIFFRSVGNKGYMNHMPHKCIRLAAEERFAYKTSIGQLCSLDIITVLDSFGREWGSCGLGEFEEYQLKDKDAKTDENPE